MHPIFLKFSPFTIYSYGVMLAVAFLLASWAAASAARRWRQDRRASLNGWPPAGPDHVTGICSWAMVGGVIGARAFFVAAEWDVFQYHPLEVLAIWHGGLVWYGGFAGGLLSGWWYLRRHRLPELSTVDQMIPFVALGHAVGRIGCFLNGCCYGRPTASWLGVVFPGGPPEPVVPTQLIEAAGLLGLYGLLRTAQRPSVLRHPGSLFGAYLVGYGLLRFLLEFWRGDQRVIWHGLTTQQLVSVVMILIGVVVVSVKISDGSRVPVHRGAG